MELHGGFHGVPDNAGGPILQLCSFIDVNNVSIHKYIYIYASDIFCITSVSLPGDDVLCWLLSCPFPSVCVPCFFSPIVFPVSFGLIPSIL